MLVIEVYEKFYLNVIKLRVVMVILWGFCCVCGVFEVDG